ncbi:MAG TPA: hypothetical protein PKJ97_04410, partial [Candidatus Bilamarchaeaceae archaeon]|nr:hypothetical protein [Candidatus Bilamarchaeaceae archaeon]
VMANAGSMSLIEAARRAFGNGAMGRVSILAGVMEHKRFYFPLAVVETQMGCSAAQINLREMLHFSSHGGYYLGREHVRSDGLYVVRAGTCAGVNSMSRSELALRIGDIGIATESYGSVGAVIQSTLRELNFVGADIPEIVGRMGQEFASGRTLSLSHDGKHLVSRASPRVLLHLQRAADRRRAPNFLGPNFSKDSLYAEMGEEQFAWLRDNYGIITTEMEQLAIDVLGAEFTNAGMPAYTGLISVCVGAIPGQSFPETPEQHEAARRGEDNIMRIAADAFAEIAMKLNR